MWEKVSEMIRGFYYDVASDTAVCSSFRGQLGGVPSGATRLYCARIGMQDASLFFAFSAQKSVCESLLKDRFTANLNDMPMTNGVPDWIIKYGPEQKIPAKWNENWDISKNGPYQILETHYNGPTTILYSPKAGRMYICMQSD